MTKKLYHQLLVTLIAVLVMASCRKDRAHEEYTETPIPNKPDLTIKITGSVAGFVTDENDQPVFNAQVVAGNKQSMTDEFGYFSIADALVPEAGAFVKITEPGYFHAYKTFIPKTGEESFVRLKLLPAVNAGSVDAAAGGAVSTPGNARVVLPADGVTLATGTPYSGAVNVAMHWIDPSDVQARQLTDPGDVRGLDKEDHLSYVKSFGTIAVQLTGSAGQALQIAGGKKAVISIPVPASMNAMAPASISLWSFDEVKGLWKEEGAATKNGNMYTGEVSHFSFWDAAIGLPLVNFTVQVTDAALHPLSNVAVGVRVAGQAFNAGGGTFGYTDVNGIVSGGVPANTSLVFMVLTPCALELYSHNFNTGSSAVDLGTVTGNMGQSLVTVSGNVVNCNNQPVTDGYVQTYDNGFYNRAAIINGAFSFTGIACTNTVTKIVAIDNNIHQQSDVQTVNLATGTNALGTISACGTSTIGVINYTIDGTPKTLLEQLGRKLMGFFTPVGVGWTTVLEVPDTGGVADISFQIDGLSVTGNAHKVTDIFSIGFANGRAYSTAGLTVTITEFGNVGGFISGQLSGQVLDFVSNAPYTFTCDFRVRRYD